MLLPPDDHLSTFRTESRRLIAAARGTDHRCVIEHLPGWNVGDVLAHVAGDFRWALDIIGRRSTVGATLGSSDRTGDELVDEISDLADRLSAELADVDPDEPCPNFTGDGTMRFWFRRQAHETTVHRWDVEVVGERQPIAPDHALDGIDEVFAVYAGRWPGHDLRGRLGVVCAGHDVAWVVSPRLDDDGRIDVVRAACADARGLDAKIVGDPVEILLLLWGRLRLDDLVSTTIAPNDEDVVIRFLAGPITA